MAVVTWVDQIEPGRVLVRSGRGMESVLRELGFRRRLLVRSLWQRAYSDAASLADLLAALRDAGVPMKGGIAGWPPSERFVQLCEQGLLSGPFDEVTWRGPGEAGTTSRSVLEPRDGDG